MSDQRIPPQSQYPDQQQAIGGGESNNQTNLKFLFNKFVIAKNL